MTLSPRQVHLDFHTSEYIPSVAAEFNPVEFAKTCKDASITSVTVFARCHHGWLYYDSKKFPERVHPELANRNLLLKQVNALHEEGIRAPIYITVQWDLAVARTRPEWLIRKRDGSFEGKPFHEPGFYQSLCVNTGYRDYLFEITEEVCTLLSGQLDGLFFDIVVDRPCWCSACRAEMRTRGIDQEDETAVRHFAHTVMDRFKAEMSAFVRKMKQDATVFYNAGHIGPETRSSVQAYSHLELESLPSGGWGYLHFPVSARYARTLSKPCLGMTGKFHTSWGDFHSLKNKAALEFECFRILSYGFACSIGDQLEPCGILNPATYRLIGDVFSKMSEREAWSLNSSAIVEAAVVTPARGDGDERIPQSILGTVQMLEELAIQFDIIDRETELFSYSLIILPDDLIVDCNYQKKIDAYVANGGKILAFANGGLSEGERYPACFGIEYGGNTTPYPDFIQVRGDLTKGLDDGEYVIYEQGVKLIPKQAVPIMWACAPYFGREGEHFCSHRYTPSAKGKAYPVGLQNGNVIVLSHPMPLQYHSNAPYWCKLIVNNAIDRLLPKRLLRHQGPSTLVTSLLHQPEQQRYVVHLLSYTPIRKCVQLDIIEERTLLHNVSLEVCLPVKIKAARLVPDAISLPIENGSLVIPKLDGYAIVELSYQS